MNKITKVIPPLIVALFSLAAITNSYAAGSLSGQIAVKLVIGDGCNVENVSAVNPTKWGDLDFGTQANLKNVIDASVTDATAGAGISVTCSTGLTTSLKINAGLNGGTGSLRYLKNGTVTIPYRLYSDSAHTTQLAVDTPVSFANNGATATKVQIFGRILPSDQGTALTPAAGLYNDTVLATIAW